MKRTLILAGLVVLCAGMVAGAGDLTVVRWSNVSCRTNTTANSTINSPVTGQDKAYRQYVVGMYVDITGTGECTNFNLCALASADMPARTVFSVASPGPSADTYYAIGNAIKNSAGAAVANCYARVPLAAQRLKVEAYNCNTTNITADVYVVLTDEP